jgi:hypothetical protein
MFENYNEGKYFLLHKHKCHTYYRNVLHIYILFVENEQYQPSSPGVMDLSHTTIHLLQQKILLVQQIVRGQQITNKLLTKLIISNGESNPNQQSDNNILNISFYLLNLVCDIEIKLQLSASR